MDEQALMSTWRAVHGVAELVLAGPRQRSHGTIRLRPVPGGIRAVATPVRIPPTGRTCAGIDLDTGRTCAHQGGRR